MMNKNINLDNIEEFRIPLTDHPLHWKFIDEDRELPSSYHDQIIPLTSEAASFLWKFERTQRIFTNKFIDPNHFSLIEEFNALGKSQKAISKWLYFRGIPFDQKVFWISQPNWGFVLTWKMVLKYSFELFFGNDEMIWDRSLNWVLYYDHNELFTFGRNRTHNTATQGEEMVWIKELMEKNKK